MYCSVKLHVQSETKLVNTLYSRNTFKAAFKNEVLPFNVGNRSKQNSTLFKGGRGRGVKEGVKIMAWQITLISKWQCVNNFVNEFSFIAIISV